MTDAIERGPAHDPARHRHPSRYDVTHNRAGEPYEPAPDVPAWVTDLSPYPAPEDYEPARTPVALSDVPWEAYTATETPDSYPCGPDSTGPC